MDDTMRRFQEESHGVGHDYESGSPHLRHPELRTWIVGTVIDAVRAAAATGARPRVLEVGAGHGPLTAHLVGAGADVVVTEMSEPSVDELRRRFAGNESVTVVHDPDGTVPVSGAFDAVVFLSVLHHIPDYLAAVAQTSSCLRPGGAMISFQDPLWYARRSRASRGAEEVLRLMWRLGQGELRRGFSTVLRRLRGVHDETSPSDMVEYHVVRDGVDERALTEVLSAAFSEVRVLRYWSTQGRAGQWLGRRFLPPNTFGLVATGRRAEEAPAARS